jgi:hypothetical protein
MTTQNDLYLINNFYHPKFKNVYFIRNSKGREIATFENKESANKWMDENNYELGEPATIISWKITPKNK